MVKLGLDAFHTSWLVKGMGLSTVSEADKELDQNDNYSVNTQLIGQTDWLRCGADLSMYGRVKTCP